MELRDALQELCDEVKKILEQRIRTYGVNPKTSQNTLEGSELQKSIKVYPIENGIELQIADYWEFVSRGWKRTGNYSGTFSQFVRNINEWIRRKGITPSKGMTQNSLAWAIIKTIWEKGLRGRPFMVYDDNGDLEKMIPELEGILDKWFDDLYATIISELDKYFNE